MTLATLSSFACSPVTSQRRYPDAIVDEAHKIYWVDNETILFKGFPKSYSPTNFGSSAIRYINLLTTTTGAIKHHADADDSGAFCFSEGFILYRQSGQILYGTVGNEVVVSENVRKLLMGRIPMSWARCTVPELPISREHPEKVVALLERHGFIEVRVPKGGTEWSCANECELLLWRQGANQPIKIKNYALLQARNILMDDIYYAPFKSAYFNSGIEYPDSKSGGKFVGWWLFPDGKTEKLILPEGNWLRFSRTNHEYLPYKNGLLINVGRPDSKIYMFQKSENENYLPPKTIFEGIVWGRAVSPDGCKLAITTGAKQVPNNDPKHMSHIEVIDLCAQM